MSDGVIYIRVSSKEQVDQHTSLDTQERECQAYAQKQHGSGVPEENIFREKGESAKFANRTELQKMMKFISKSRGAIKYLYIWKIDRFARNINDYLSLKVALARYGVRIVSVTEPIEDDPVGRFMESILAAAAQFDNEIRSIRTVTGMRATVEYGRWPHQAPIGYMKKDKRILPDPKWGSIVQSLLITFSEGGHSLSQMSRIAFEKGLHTKRGTPKTTDQMKTMMQNWIYAGFTISKLSEKKNKGLHAPLVDENIIQKNVELITGKPVNYVKRGDDLFPLKGTLLCSNCHNPLRASTSKGNGGLYPYYHCPRPTCRKSITGKKTGEDSSIVHREFRELLDSWKPLKGIESLFRAVVEREWNNTYESALRSVERVGKQINEQRELRASAIRKYTGDKISREDRDMIVTACDAEVEHLTDELDEAETYLGNCKEIVDSAMEFINNPKEFWNRASKQVKKDVQRLLFPNGIDYDFETGFGTVQRPETYLLIKKMADKSAKNPDLVVAAGIEPATLGL